jgi:hypothetical protein
VWNNAQDNSPLEGVHTFAVQKVDGLYAAYNRFCDDTEERTYHTLSEMLENDTFMLGYKIVR